MYLIVGLGNPGESYARTRHNVGFQCVSYLAERHRLRFDEHRSKSILASGMIAGQKVVLAKPQTFMNGSGEAVGPLARWYKLDPASELLVIYDELDLPAGTIRLKPAGSAGGHNGMKSIIQHLGTQAFPRLRVGIGRPPQGWQVIDYVLGAWSREQAPELPHLYQDVADAVELFIRDGIDAAMNRFNGGARG
jgi:peptidyl-tRNA hydrolase, PTH1 family